MSYGRGKSHPYNLYGMEPAFFCEGNMLVYILRRGIPGFVIRVFIFFPATAISTSGKVKILFYPTNPIEQIAFRGCDQGSTYSKAFDFRHCTGTQQMITFIFYSIDTGKRICPNKVDCHIIVPNNIQPFTKIIPVLYRKLQKDKFIDSCF